MSRRLFCVCAVFAALIPAAPATASVTTDLNDWNLTTTFNTWGSAFHVSSSGDGTVSYRWLDSPNKATNIRAIHCSDGSLHGADSIDANNTTYHELFTGFTTQCFLLRGQTTSGTLTDHDGRVKR